MNTTPIRHGDWHVIDGQLIDLPVAATFFPGVQAPQHIFARALTWPSLI